MPGVKLTYEDLVRLPDDGLRRELIDGELHVSPAPSFQHQVVVANLTILLGMHLRVHPVGVVAGGPDIVPAKHTRLQPDVVYLSKERARTVRKKTYLAGAPELVIEVASPSTRHYDLTAKRSAYEGMDVLEYWFVDVDAGAVSIYRRSSPDQPFATPTVLKEAEANVTTPLLPGLQLSLAELFNMHE